MNKTQKNRPMNHPGGNGTFTVKPIQTVGAWLSLRNNNYTTVTAMCEFIDNILNKDLLDKNEKVTISFDWYISKKYPSKSLLVVKDTAEGITRNLLQSVFTLGASSVKNINKLFSEHGHGMKAAILSLGDFNGFKTKNDDEDTGSLLVKTNISDKNTDEAPVLNFKPFEDITFKGTTITMKNLEEGLIPATRSLGGTVSSLLGAIYRTYLEKNSLQIVLRYTDLDSNKMLFDEIVKPHNRVWAHGTKRDNNGAPKQEPDLPMMTIKGPKRKNQWEAKFVAGYKPTEDEAFAMTGKKNIFPEGSPYRVSSQCVGFDVIKNGRTILFGTMGDAASGRGNYLQGEIHLVSGFTTTTTKDAMRTDRNWKELEEKILQLVKDHRLDDRVKSGFKRVRGTELQVTGKIVEAMRQMTPSHTAWGVKDSDEEIKQFVELYNTNGNPIGECDILITPSIPNKPEQIYEVKKEEADTDAVRQLFGYMKARGVVEGVVVAQKLTSKARNLMHEFNKNHDVNITFWDYTTLGMFN